MRMTAAFVAASLLAAPAAVAQRTTDRQQCGDSKNNPKAAIAACTRIISGSKLRGVELSLIYSFRAYWNQLDGNVDQSIADNTRAIELEPRYNPGAYLNRGNDFATRKDFDRAIADYNRSIEIDAEFEQAYSARGDIHRKRMDFAKAMADYTKCIVLNPKVAIYWEDRADVHALLGQYDSAIADATKSLAIKATSGAHFTRGVAHFNRGDYKAASADLRKSNDLSASTVSVAYLYLSRSLAGEDAKSDLEANASRLKEKTWPYAVIEHMLGTRDGAATLAAADGAAETCVAHYFFGLWQLAKGNRDAAANALRTAVEMCPKSVFELEGARAALKRMNP